MSKRRAVTTSSHPIAQLASHNSGTTRTKSGGKRFGSEVGEIEGTDDSRPDDDQESARAL